jgi:membrane protein YdbS with pleckstrin-like domain
MPGCCLIALLLFLGPRAALALAWFFTDWYAAFTSTIVAFLGFLLLPWTTLAWMYTFFHNHGALSGGYVVLVVLGAIADLSAYGGHQRYRRWRQLE